MTLAGGSRLGAYEILSPLGAGGMGDVYRARDAKLGREIAVKVLPAGVSADPGRRQRFEQEARSASALKHLGIVTIYGIDVENAGVRQRDRRAWQLLRGGGGNERKDGENGGTETQPNRHLLPPACSPGEARAGEGSYTGGSIR